MTNSSSTLSLTLQNPSSARSDSSWANGQRGGLIIIQLVKFLCMTHHHENSVMWVIKWLVLFQLAIGCYCPLGTNCGQKLSSQQGAFILVCLSVATGLLITVAGKPVVCFRLGVIKRVIEWGLRRKEVNVKQTQPGQAGDFMSAAWVSLLWQFSFYRFIQTVAPARNHPVGRHQVWPSEITFRTPKSGPSTYCKQWSLSTTRR